MELSQPTGETEFSSTSNNKINSASPSMSTSVPWILPPCSKTYNISLDIRQSFFFQNNHKDQDPSYKMDLDFWDCLGRVKLVL